MANSNLFIGINRGDDGFQHDQISVQSTTNAGKDIELRVNAVDANGGTVRRKDAIKAIEAFKRVLTSNGVFTTDLAE